MQGVNQSGYDELDDLSDSDDASAGYADGKAVRILVVDEVGRVLTVVENHGRTLPGGKVLEDESWEAAAVRKL